jgi:rod shape-determining protein MreC
MRNRFIFSKILLGIISVLLVILLLNGLFYNQLKNIVFTLVGPLGKFFIASEDNLSDILISIFKSGALKEENEALKEENFFLKNKLLEINSLQRENQELRKALSIGLQEEFKLIFAPLVLKDASEGYFLVGKGKKEGVKKGMVAITQSRVLIGKVDKVFDDYAQVVLISKKDFTFPVKISRLEKEKGKESVSAEELGASGVAKGGGGYQMRIELLPKDIEFKKGDIVSSTLLGNIFPENLLVGEIKNVKKDDSKAFQEAEVKIYLEGLNVKNLFLIEKR